MTTAPAKPPAPDETLRFRVTGMSCAGCAATVQRAIESEPGVAEAQVSVTDGLATVAGTGLATDRLVAVIEGKGFGAEPLGDRPDIAALRSDIEARQEKAERAWRFRAITGLGIWVPMAIVHWTVDAPWVPWFMLAGATVVLATAGAGFFRSAWSAARRGTTNMDTLIAIGASAAYVFSLVVFVARLLGHDLDQPLYFGEAAALLGIISLGHWLEARASYRAGSAVRDLLELQPETAELLDDADGGGHAGHAEHSATDGSTSDAEPRTVPTAEIRPGDRVLIRPGDRVPVDGRVLEGASEVDEAVVSGESLPVPKHPGDAVVAGALNTTGRLVVESTVDGRDTTVARIAELVQRAQTSKARVQRVADRVCAVFVPAVLTIAAITLIGWSIAGNAPKGVIAMVTVLIISCPCALGLATPMAVMVGTGAASRRGILFKSAQALESAGRAVRVIFDKTGTLTTGAMDVAQVVPHDDGADPDELLRWAAAVEAPSEHPIARAIVAAARERGLDVAPADDFSAQPGEGVAGTVDGRRVEVRRAEGATCAVVVDGTELGTITVADHPREDAKGAVARLHRLGLTVGMLSGDRRPVAEAIGQAVGLDASLVIAEATPDEKEARVGDLGAGTVMVGDGLNDAAALARADVGIAIDSGTNVAIESADVVIPSDRIDSVPDTIVIARETLRTIHQNLFFAFVYNAAMIPVAALGLLGTSGPVIAAIAMAASDITVIGNALRLRAGLRRL